MEDTTICWKCKKEIPYKDYMRTYCNECVDIVKQEEKSQLKEYVKLKSLMMYKNALNIMEKQKINMHYYYEACNVVKERLLEKPETFESSYEIMACIELINNQVRVKMQQKFGKYCADILLPDLKVIIEIDGYLHNNSKIMLRDAKRDIEILNQLGSGWEIIRFKTAYIEKKLIYLLDDIKKIYKERQLLRRQNHGILPDSYSDYTKILYKDLLGIYKYDKDYKTEQEQKEWNEQQELKCYK